MQKYSLISALDTLPDKEDCGFLVVELWDNNQHLWRRTILLQFPEEAHKQLAKKDEELVVLPSDPLSVLVAPRVFLRELSSTSKKNVNVNLILIIPCFVKIVELFPHHDFDSISIKELSRQKHNHIVSEDTKNILDTYLDLHKNYEEDFSYGILDTPPLTTKRKLELNQWDLF